MNNLFKTYLYYCLAMISIFLPIIISVFIEVNAIFGLSYAIFIGISLLFIFVNKAIDEMFKKTKT